MVQAPRLRPHRRDGDVLGDRNLKLGHSMAIAASPLPSATDQPLWARLQTVATDGVCMCVCVRVQVCVYIRVGV